MLIHAFMEKRERREEIGPPTSEVPGGEGESRISFLSPKC
jgi:hypothetical protein